MPTNHVLILAPNKISPCQLGRSPRRMDLYAWLSYRLPRIPARRQVPISLDALHSIFGQDITTRANFRKRLVLDLNAIATIYPDFRLELEGNIVWLRKSPPPVAYEKVIHKLAP